MRGKHEGKAPPGAAEAAGALLDLLYPPALYCGICGRLIDGTRPYHLCDICIRRIRWDHDPASERNGLRMMRVAEYGIYERSLIFSLKYNGKRNLARDIAEMAGDRLAEAGEFFDIVVPIPLSEKKLRRRGFNQTTLIGKYLARRTGTRMSDDALLRVRETRPMRGLSKEERAENIRGAFLLNGKRAAELAGKRILLLDDFATTGATSREAAAELKKAAPEGILFLAFAARYGEALSRREANGACLENSAREAPAGTAAPTGPEQFSRQRGKFPV